MTLKDKVLAELMLADGDYCSGERLAEKFSVTRAAVWKVMEQLKAQGCQIDAVTSKGYLLKEIPDLYSQTYLLSLLQDTKSNWQIQHFDEIDSTNALAKKLAFRGAPQGTVITADVQTAGRGRLGKSFHSPQGGLYLSVIGRPVLAISSMMSVTACTAVVVHQALQAFGVETEIKWVNDLFLNGKKICGILSEGGFNAEFLKMDYLVIGIGINLRPDPHLPEELKPIVTDVQTETGMKINKCQLIAEILRNLETYSGTEDGTEYLKIYTEHSCTLGHRVRTDTGLEGLAVGFADDAGLQIRLEDGSEMILRTGSAQIID